MRILFITQYYLPETGAPQNRLSGLARELTRLGATVEVLTSMPNYPQMVIQEAYRGKFFCSEVIQDIKVSRAWIYAGKKRGIFFRLLNYFSFVFTSLLVSGRIKGTFDFVLCESPPLFLGISAYFISKRKRAKLVFNVSDLWPESAEKLGLVTNRFFLGIAYKLEAWLYSKSILVSGQTIGICNDIVKRFPSVRTKWLPNGIDPGRFNPDLHSAWRRENGFSESDFILIYAGIIGHAQGLEIIVKCAERLKSDARIKFVLLGDGPEKEMLKERVVNQNLENVFFFPSVPGEMMPGIIAAMNAAIIPLRKLDLFKGAIPSKIFENLAMEKPILLGVEGEAKQLFIDQGNCGLFFEPENDIDLSEKIIQLVNNPTLLKQLGKNGRDYVYRFFNRETIAAEFHSELLKLQ